MKKPFTNKKNDKFEKIATNAVFTMFSNKNKPVVMFDSHTYAEGTLTQTGDIIVAEGSDWQSEDRKNYDSARNKSTKKFRKDVSDTGVISGEQGNQTFNRDFKFGSLSRAADCINTIGNADGWLAWKDFEGKTLKEYRLEAYNITMSAIKTSKIPKKCNTEQKISFITKLVSERLEG